MCKICGCDPQSDDDFEPIPQTVVSPIPYQTNAPTSVVAQGQVENLPVRTRTKVPTHFYTGNAIFSAPLDQAFDYEPDHTNIFKLKPDEKLVVCADIEGDLDKLLQFLHLIGVTNKKYEWLGHGSNETTLVFLGDLSGKGPDSYKIYVLLLHLRRQAQQMKSGRVILLAGFHEIMLMLGVWTFLSTQDRLVKTASKYHGNNNVQSILAVEIQNFLMALPVECIVGKVACSHSGILQNYTDVDATNQSFSRELREIQKKRNNPSSNLVRAGVDAYQTAQFQNMFVITNGLNLSRSASPAYNDKFVKRTPDQSEPEKLKRKISDDLDGLDSLDNMDCNVMAVGTVRAQCRPDVAKRVSGRYLACLDVSTSRYFSEPADTNTRIGFLHVYNYEHKTVYIDGNDIDIRYLEEEEDYVYYIVNSDKLRKKVSHGIVQLPKTTKKIFYDSGSKNVEREIEFLNGIVFMMTIETETYY